MKFGAAERELTAAGFTVLNPAILPYPALTHEQYMQIGFVMLDACAALCLLDDWRTSPGAVREKARAEASGKRIFLYELHQWEDGRIKFSIKPQATGGNVCRTCWCCDCMNIAKCLVNGFACFACAEKGPEHRQKPKESGLCGGYTKVENAED